MLPLSNTSSFYMIIFNVALMIWWVPEAIGAFFQRSGATATRLDRGSYVVLAVSMFIGAFLGFWLARIALWAAIPWNRPLLFWLGIVLIVGGVSLRWYAIYTLGQWFTRDVAVRAGQTVVQTGPYHWIRHPAYTGILVTLLGIGLALSNWLSLIVILLGTLTGLFYRVQVEEKALRENLGQPYSEYMERTWRFIPFIW